MRNNLNGAEIENAPLPIGRHNSRSTSKTQCPLIKPNLRSFQALRPKRGRETVSRTLRPFGNSEARVDLLTEDGCPKIRISTIEGGRRHHLDLRASDLQAIINGCHVSLSSLGVR